MCVTNLGALDQAGADPGRNEEVNRSINPRREARRLVAAVRRRLRRRL